jgi:hypothetical protein
MKSKLLVLIAVFGLLSCKSAPLVAPENLAAVNNNVETKIDTASIYFNSRDPFCKSPFGAVVQSTEVHFNILVKSGDIVKAMLVVSTQNIVGNATMEKYKEFLRVPMSVSGVTNGQDIWTASVKLDQIGVYGYCFELVKNDDDGIVYGDNQDTVDVPYVQVRGTGGIGMITELGSTNCLTRLRSTQTTTVGRRGRRT